MGSFALSLSSPRYATSTAPLAFSSFLLVVSIQCNRLLTACHHRQLLSPTELRDRHLGPDLDADALPDQRQLVVCLQLNDSRDRNIPAAFLAIRDAAAKHHLIVLEQLEEVVVAVHSVRNVHRHEEHSIQQHANLGTVVHLS
jgi:hypothetical protein